MKNSEKHTKSISILFNISKFFIHYILFQKMIIKLFIMNDSINYNI